MATISEALAVAIQHHQAGRLQAAEQIYRQILAIEPHHADAWHLLGVIACQVGKHEVAIEYLGQAIGLKGTDAGFHNNLGEAYRALRRIPEAIACYHRALELNPNYAEAYSNLGNACTDQGKLDEAVAYYRRALELKPDHAGTYNNLGNVLKGQGDLDEAVACYRQAVELKPDLVEAHNNLGAALSDQGKLDEAVACYRRALQGKPDFAQAYSNLGNALKEQGKLDEAVACCRRAVELRPEFAELHHNLGNALRDQRKLDEAAACYRGALERKPDYAEAHNSLALVFGQQGRFDEAAACARRALELKPDFVEALTNLGNALKEQGRFDEAIACCRRAVELKPDYAEAHNNLGAAFQDQGKPDEAIACYRRVLELKPDYAEAHYNLGSAFQSQAKLDEAVACCRRALELKPDYAEAHNNLGAALHDQGKLDGAIACYRRALELKPDFADAHGNLGAAMKLLGRLDEAIACYRRVLELKPDDLSAMGTLVHQLQHACCWPELNDLCRRVVDGVDRGLPLEAAAPTPFSFLTMAVATSPEQQLACARHCVKRRLKTESARGRERVFARPSDANSKLTIGYLSADYHAHATAYLIAELFEQHERHQFSIFGYSFGPDDGSPMRRRIAEAFDRFVDVKDATFLETAERIAADKVDILVDLKGYTTDARTQILAFRPAPVQVSYLGYPGTMGAPFMDYILVDDFVVPPDQQRFFTEKVVYLPGCYQVNDGRREISPHTPSRGECGLPEEGFVFCDFNNSYKITPAMFGAWMELLQEVPGSVLWLLEGNRFVAANLRREAEARGVAAPRLVFAPRCPLPEHLARHRLADLFLDTFPVSAHTTASDALWAGCPVLTIAGPTFISRVAGSLLRTTGLPELVTESLEEYRAMALRLARDAGLLAGLRTRLEANRKTSPLFDARRFARSIEEAYVTMWQIYASGQPPRAFTVSPGDPR